MGLSRLRQRVVVRGRVQGVGFRPFVYREAMVLGLTGWVTNTPQGVVIEVQGQPDALDALSQRIRCAAPAAARVSSVEVGELALRDETGFEIRPSGLEGPCAALPAPDMAPCAACLDELFDPLDRRHRYPFINCTQCGPRYSIATGLPYDRSRTTMRSFVMCPPCRAEYEDPMDRRFHAQPNACPECGPRLAWHDRDGVCRALGEAAMSMAVAALEEGQVVALKGVGGYQLIVDGTCDEAVARLRVRKGRPHKPFALMVASLEAASALCDLSEAAGLLSDPSAPIVLLDGLDGAPVSHEVAPNLPWLGIMLPSSPLHHLLARAIGLPLVVTSGNLSSEPLYTDDEAALSGLAGIADGFLSHDRPIANPVDDSVLRVFEGEGLALRVARGLSPFALPWPTPSSGALLALGAHQKNAVAVATSNRIICGPHIGDLGSERARAASRANAQVLMGFVGTSAMALACDHHPEYGSTREASVLSGSLGVPIIAVQHHVAHVAACAAEHGLSGPVLGVAFDGTGDGCDGTIWGGECLVRASEGGSWVRVAHLPVFPLPGGERAIREPRRSALGVLYALNGDALFDDLPPALARAFSDIELRNLRVALTRGLNCPLTTSAGRLFDAAAALLGLCEKASYEAEGAMRVEACARGGGASAGAAWRFHDGLAQWVVSVAQERGVVDVVLTGGCFQNTLLLGLCVRGLRAAGFTPWWPHRLPPNDGGLALGQAVQALEARGE